MLNNREQLRQPFFTAWKKSKTQQPLSLLEKNIMAILEMHPEYLPMIENNSETLNTDFRTDNNPFLHMALHLSLREQLVTHRPKGINAIYQELCYKHQNIHYVEHQMMDVMANLLWEAQQKGHLPDDATYLKWLRTTLLKIDTK